MNTVGIARAGLLLLIATAPHVRGEGPTGTEEARAAYQAGDFKRAAELARVAARGGDAGGQSLLGELYYFGKGVGLDLEAAVRWWQLASAKGDLSAKSWLGFCYRVGHGVPEDRARAESLLLEAADGGQARAQDDLVRMYLGTDPAKALTYLRKAAEQGFVPSQHFIGTLYRDGTGLPRNYQLAHEWIRKAAEQNNPWAQLDLGALYAEGKGARRDDVEAYKWLVLAASQSGGGDDQIAADAESWILMTLQRRMSDDQVTEARTRALAFLRQRGIPAKLKY